jgi:hypothetical protein
VVDRLATTTVQYPSAFRDVQLVRADLGPVAARWGSMQWHALSGMLVVAVTAQSIRMAKSAKSALNKEIADE